MNKILYFMLLALCWACASQGDDALRGVVTVNITAKLDPACQQSRSGADETTTRCYVEIMRNGASEGLTQLQANGDGSYSLSPTLYVGSDYKFYFWADPGEDYFSLDASSDLSRVTMLEPAVAYWGSASLTPSDGTNSISVELTHAVAKVSFVTSTALQLASSEAGNTVTMTGLEFYSSINVHAVDGNDDWVIGNPKSRDYSTVLTSSVEANEAVLVAYGFVSKESENQSVMLQYGFATAVTVSNVPVATNTHTQLLGDISNQALVSVTASISPEWNSEGDEDDEDDDDGIEGYEWIDLGTSVLWANKNLGASSTSDSGDYYQWGALTPVDVDNFPTSYDNVYVCDQYNILSPEYDAAVNKKRGRMPTSEEFQELLSSSAIAPTNDVVNGQSGYRFINSNTGNSIFFPKCGYYNPSGTFTEGMMYWTSTAKTYNSNYLKGSTIYMMNVYSLTITTGTVSYALPIRPVSDKN